MASTRCPLRSSLKHITSSGPFSAIISQQLMRHRLTPETAATDRVRRADPALLSCCSRSQPQQQQPRHKQRRRRRHRHRQPRRRRPRRSGRTAASSPRRTPRSWRRSWAWTWRPSAAPARRDASPPRTWRPPRTAAALRPQVGHPPNAVWDAPSIRCVRSWRDLNATIPHHWTVHWTASDVATGAGHCVRCHMSEQCPSAACCQPTLLTWCAT